MTKASRPTNHYLFDAENKMYLAKVFYPNGYVQKEYIVREKDIVYGFVYDADQDNYLSEISIEEYKNDKLLSYLWGACYYFEDKGYSFSFIMSEFFDYPDDGHLETDFYFMQVLDYVSIINGKSRFKLDADSKIIRESRLDLGYKEIRLERSSDIKISM